MVTGIPIRHETSISSMMRANASLSTSLHPKLSLELSPSPNEGCIAQLALQLPDELLLDRDELVDFFVQGGVRGWSLSPRIIDIERPVRDVEASELSTLCLELEGSMVHVPLHARYLTPIEDGHRTVGLFNPGDDGTLCGAWVCDAREDHSASACQNFPPIDVNPVSVTLPAGRPSHLPLVEFGTTVAMWLGAFYIIYVILRRPYPSKTKTS